MTSNSLEGYQQYLQKQPDGGFRMQANQKINQLKDDLDWEYAKAQNTTSAYEKYLRDHPRGIHAEEAQAQLEKGKRDHIVAKDDGTAAVLKKFNDYYNIERDNRHELNDGSPAPTVAYLKNGQFIVGTQSVYESKPDGKWQVISPNLTLDDGKDHITSIVVQRDNEDIRWVGNKSGLIHFTIDGGERWTNVTPKYATGDSPQESRTYIKDRKYYAYEITNFFLDFKNSIDALVLAQTPQKSLLFATRNSGKNYFKVNIPEEVGKVERFSRDLFPDRVVLHATSGKRYTLTIDENNNYQFSKKD